MIVLKNENLYVEIHELGAEIRKVEFKGKDRFWSGDKNVWSGVSPILFPICSGLVDDKFTFENKEYTLEKHGFARKSIFSVEYAGDTTATFLLADSPETLIKYPWKFELRITYTLIDDNIEIFYNIKNIDSKTMYYSIGAHEAYACDDIENYDIIFEKEETLDSFQLEGTVLSGKTKIFLKNSKVFPLYKRYFKEDALIFKNLNSRFVTLKNRISEEKVSVEFKGFDYLLFWHVYGSNYICIEPWAGISSTKGDSLDITKKEGILKLSPNTENTLKHTIYF